MPIITKPNTILKDVASTMTLDKAALALLSEVVNDPYFSDDSNWKRVTLNYKSSIGNQRAIVNFDATGVTPEGRFKVSALARDNFIIESLVIHDFTGGVKTIYRSELVTTEFDVVLGLIPVLTLYATRNFSGPYQAPAEAELAVGSTTITSPLTMVGGAGLASYRILYPTTTNINDDVKTNNLIIRVYPTSITGTGSVSVGFTPDPANFQFATSAEVQASVTEKGYYEFSLPRTTDNTSYVNFNLDWTAPTTGDIITISKFEIYQQDV